MNQQLDAKSYGIGQPVRRVEDLRFLTGAAALSMISSCRTRRMPSSCSRRMRMRASAASTQRRRAARPASCVCSPAPT